MKKLTEEEHSKVLAVQQSAIKIFAEIGQLYLQKSVLLKELTKIESDLEAKENEFNNISKEQSELYNQLLEKYGEGQFDPETGEFKPEN